MTQRTDRQVERDAARFNDTKRGLESFLRRQGIRNPHTSPKAREAILRAATVPLTDEQARRASMQGGRG